MAYDKNYSHGGGTHYQTLKQMDTKKPADNKGSEWSDHDESEEHEVCHSTTGGY